MISTLTVHRTGIFLLLVLFAITLHATSQRDSLFRNQFVNYSVKDGLPSTVVYDVVQDDLGFMWFATESGLSRFNGVFFENFTIEDGLPDNDIIGFTKDSKGLIWLHSLSGVAVCKPTVKPEFHTFHIFDGYSFRALSLWEGKYHFLFDKGPQTQLFIWDTLESQITVDTIPTSGRTMLFEGEVWKEGLNSFYRVYPHGQPLSIPNSPPYASHFPRCKRRAQFFKLENDVLIFCGDSLSSLRSTYTIPFPSEDIYKLFIDQDSTCWLVSQNDGLFSFPLDSTRTSRSYTNLAGSPISNMCKDRQGNYWFTSLSDGVFFLSRYQSFARTFVPTGSSIQQKIQQVTQIENKAIAMGTGSSEILVWDGVKMQNLNWKTSLRFQRTRGIISFGKDSLLAFNDKEAAIFALNGSSEALLTLDFGFKDLQRDSNGRLWFGNSQSVGNIPVSHFNSPKLSYEKFLTSETIHRQRGTAIFWDPSQSLLWVGNPAGLHLWKIDSLRFRIAPRLVLKASVLKIKHSPQGDIWVATDGKGVFAVRKGYSPSHVEFKHFSVENGALSSNTCRTMAFGKSGDVWIATNKGIDLIEKFSWEKPAESHRTDHLNVAHGLLSNNVNDLALLNDTLYAGTDKGLAVLSLDGFQKRNKDRTEVLITKVRILERDTFLADHFELDYQQRNIKFDFVGLNYASQGNIVYRYKMVPMEKKWIETTQNFAHYPSLDPGDYTFMVKAVNVDGLESQATTQVGLHVAPIWWDTILFKLGVALCLFLLLGGIFYYRLRMIRKREKLQSKYHQQIADYRRQSLASQMNPHFIFNALVAVQGFILKSDVRTANKYLAKFSKLIRGVLEGSQHKSISLSEEIKSLRLYLELELLRFGDRFQYEISVAEDLFPGSVRIPPMILQPFAENAIRHGLKPLQGEGRLLVTFEMEQDQLKCTIEDNGVGRQQASKLKSKHHTEYQSRGMELTINRINLLNQQLGKTARVDIQDLTDSEGNACGTRVTLFFPPM